MDSNELYLLHLDDGNLELYTLDCLLEPSKTDLENNFCQIPRRMKPNYRRYRLTVNNILFLKCKNKYLPQKR